MPQASKILNKTLALSSHSILLVSKECLSAYQQYINEILEHGLKHYIDNVNTLNKERISQDTDKTFKVKKQLLPHIKEDKALLNRGLQCLIREQEALNKLGQSVYLGDDYLVKDFECGIPLDVLKLKLTTSQFLALLRTLKPKIAEDLVNFQEINGHSHGDVRLSNILLTKSGKTKLIDFENVGQYPLSYDLEILKGL